MEWTTEDYRRLGDKLRAARRESGYRHRRDFEAWLDGQPDKQMSGRTYADIESGRLRTRKRFSPDSLAYLEDLFGWAPGVTRAILDGRSVDVHTGIGESWPDAGGSEIDAAMDRDLLGMAYALGYRIDELEVRVDQLERRFRPRKPKLPPPEADTP